MILLQADSRQARERDRATYAAWGEPLSAEDYQEAEGRLRAHAWSRAVSAMWLLCSDRGEVLCSCETFRMPSRFTPDHPRSGHVHGIASVFTAPDHRGRGYAGELLHRLAGALSAADPGSQALILFSDVPPSIYLKSGFSLRPAYELVSEAGPEGPKTGVEFLTSEPEVRRALERILPATGRFVISPVPEQLDWHLERERILAAALGRPRPAAWGALAGEGTALWTADHRHDQLVILALHTPGPAKAADLMACARRTAFACGLARVVLWQTPELASLRFPGTRLVDRSQTTKALPMIRPLDPEIQPGDWTWIPRILWM